MTRANTEQLKHTPWFAKAGPLAAQPHRSPFLCHARRLLRSLGTSFLALHNWRVILPNRRVRTRTHGGVTGKASDRLPMSIPWPAFLPGDAGFKARSTSAMGRTRKEVFVVIVSMSALAI
jgi:hypothetical protein